MSDVERAEFVAVLRERLKGRVLLVGIGNSMRGDDGCGPKLIELVKDKVKAQVLDVGETPESYSGRILAAQADTVMLVDAADFGATPGELTILEPDELPDRSLATHQMPLCLFCRYIKENSGANVFALAVQAAEIGLGQPMSAAVSQCVEELAELLQEIIDD